MPSLNRACELASCEQLPSRSGLLVLGGVEARREEV
jgi:hypothetical protein